MNGLYLDHPKMDGEASSVHVEVVQLKADKVINSQRNPDCS